MVYEQGAGVEPIRIINVSSDLSEKSFHYDIMAWVADNGE